MTTAKATHQEIVALTTGLIEAGIVDSQNYPTIKAENENIEIISFPRGENLSAALKNVEYRHIYSELLSSGAFNFCMADGGLIQLQYTFKNGTIRRHRLAYFPSPSLEHYQNEPEIYQEDEIFADILEKNILPVPIRFDFDASDEIYIELHHARSHLTLGQYKNCRIPVCAPLNPSQFIDFVLRSFYNTALRKLTDKLPRTGFCFPRSISEKELAVLHLSFAE